MARNMREQYSEAYRAAVEVTTTHENQYQSVRVFYYGPFATAGAAEGQITREVRDIERRQKYYQSVRVTYSESARGWIEKSSTSWERVE